MSLRINTNVEAINAHRNLERTSASLSKSMERLSSGLRINHSGDDVAGQGISEKLTSQINGLQQASRNTQDAISFVQTAEGSLNEVHSMLQRVRELAVQYNNGTVSTDDQTAITGEVNHLASEINRTAASAKFNGIALFTSDTTVSFQVGANDGDQIGVNLKDMSADLTSAMGGVSLGSLSLGNAAILASIDAAIGAITTQRGELGSVQNRLEHTNNALGVSTENLTAANSRIMDVDMANEAVQMTKLQVLTQAGTAMLAQANQSPQNVLRLLQ